MHNVQTKLPSNKRIPCLEIDPDWTRVLKNNRNTRHYIYSWYEPIRFSSLLFTPLVVRIVVLPMPVNTKRATLLRPTRRSRRRNGRRIFSALDPWRPGFSKMQGGGLLMEPQHYKIGTKNKIKNTHLLKKVI